MGLDNDPELGQGTNDSDEVSSAWGLGVID